MGVATERVIEVLDPVVSASGLDLEAVEVQALGRRRLLRVLVDRDGGISLDEVAALSRALSAALDADDVMGEQPYVLEVSSPGVDRPLTLPRHWRRANGRLVEAVLTDGTSVSGRVGAADESSVALATDTGVATLRYEQVSRAHIQVEFRRPDESQE